MMGFLFVMVVIGRMTLLSSLSLRMGSTMGNSIGLKCSGVGVGVGNCNMGDVVGAWQVQLVMLGSSKAIGKWAVEGKQGPGCCYRWCSCAYEGLS